MKLIRFCTAALVVLTNGTPYDQCTLNGTSKLKLELLIFIVSYLQLQTFYVIKCYINIILGKFGKKNLIDVMV